jgi:hypothetical protein
MKKILLAIISSIVLFGLIAPFGVSARERQDYVRDTGRDTPTEETDVTDNDGADGEEGASGNNGNNGGTVYIKNSVVISTESGGNDESGEDGVNAGDADASVTVETIINGEVVQDISSNGEEVLSDRDALREARKANRYSSSDGNVVVETEIDIEEGNSESNETGNTSKNGADGEDGADGADGASEPEDEPVIEEEEEEKESDDGRRDRGERSGRGGIAMIFDYVSNIFNNVFGFFLA